MNYPDRVIPHVLGTDMSKTIEAVASGVAAAGYRKPRTITTVEELDTLPVGSVIASLIERPGTGLVCQKKLDGQWYFTADEGGVSAGYIKQWREVTVLWEPQP